MKKTLILFGFVALFAFVFTSCKSHETCPAYGKVSKQNSIEKRI